MKALAGIAVGVCASLAVVHVSDHISGHRPLPRGRLVAEDASAPLRQIAIHYAPKADRVALGVYRQLFAVLPARVDVEVEVAAPADFDRFIAALAGTPNLERFHPVIVGAPITTWSRDRYAALDDDEILAPPRVEVGFADRAGDARSPGAIARAIYHRDPHVTGFAFEGGDLAATPRFVFADANLAGRNLGRGADVSRSEIELELHRRLGQELVWLGDKPGDVPRHHIMMYMVPLDDRTVAVGDVRAGVALLAREPAGAQLELDDIDLEARRFDHAAELLAARGFHVVRVPALVLDGAAAFVTYTNALFDRRGATRIVYLPTYALPALDQAAASFYAAQGFEVHPIDVSPLYRLDGSLGCVVNVLGRG